jgi:hypothetical protein
MSNNKQSIIDFLIKQKEKYGMIINDDLRIAKEMHRKEHGQTWDKSLDNLKARGLNEMRAWVDFDEYYNETFGGNK